MAGRWAKLQSGLVHLQYRREDGSVLSFSVLLTSVTKHIQLYELCSEKKVKLKAFLLTKRVLQKLHFFSCFVIELVE